MVKLFVDIDAKISSDYTVEDYKHDFATLCGLVRTYFGASSYFEASYTITDRYSSHIIWGVVVHMDV
jgi:hypothetical protein